MWNNRENRLLRRALALYAGDHVLAKVLEKREAFLSPQGAYAELTMLFYDVAWIKETPGMDPKSLSAWGGALAEIGTSTVKKNGGVFDTFVGDAGSAWWDLANGDRHAEQAIACARELVQAVAELNGRAPSLRYPIRGLKIGVHTGTVALGNWGSRSRLRFCPMGDAVNVAARLCNVVQHHAVSIALSEATRSSLGEDFPARFLDRVAFKGESQPLAIYGIDEASGGGPSDAPNEPTTDL